LEAVGRHGWPLHLKGRIPGLRRQLARDSLVGVGLAGWKHGG
jgi:hypothetical protein